MVKPMRSILIRGPDVSDRVKRVALTLAEHCPRLADPDIVTATLKDHGVRPLGAYDAAYAVRIAEHLQGKMGRPTDQPY